MKIAITTASGGLGKSVIKQAVKEFGTENIIGIARTPEKVEEPGIEIRKGDYNSKEDFLTALKAVDVVLLVSGSDTPDKRIQQHRNIIEAAKENGVRKIVYSSIFGKEGQSTFDAIIKSNRQTEKDIRESGLDWAIGRNGLYLEPDLEFAGYYLKTGKISNCAGIGRCAYTNRKELAIAYTELIRDDEKSGDVFNLTGEPITQNQLARYISEIFNARIEFENLTVDEYREDRIKAHGEFFGNIIAGIYVNILNGAFDVKSDYRKATGREHQDHMDFMREWQGGRRL